MKPKIAYFDVRIYPDYEGSAPVPRVTAVRIGGLWTRESIGRTYDWVTQSSFNRVIRAQQKFMR